jgi:hypothetical protein
MPGPPSSLKLSCKVDGPPFGSIVMVTVLAPLEFTLVQQPTALLLP